SKATIRSPIDGIVLVRSIDPGQTVAASLQAPVLFTMAEDLKEMDLEASIGEADVAYVHAGQSATFTVSAFPDRTFLAQVRQVHLASSSTQQSTGVLTAVANARSSATPASSMSVGASPDVVSYKAKLEVDNSDLLLRPGMVASVRIVTGTRENAILVPYE